MSGSLRGMLLGGAVGDALGAPVEFMSLDEIRRTFGPDGITEFAPAYGKLGAITDDTQMSLFVFEGLIRAHLRYLDRGMCGPGLVVGHGLLRWAVTQGIEVRDDVFWKPDGWLLEQRVLHARRAPGNTCLASLRDHGATGGIEAVANTSKGCGSVMRSAPFAVCNEARAYELAAETSMFTHGHPVATDAAGCFAEMCRILVEGASIIEAVTRVEARTEEVRAALHAAEEFVYTARGVPPTPEQLETLGAGWVAEEALGIAAACAMLAEDLTDASHEDRFEAGVRLAVNHSGDSDSTGSMAGNLLGARYGEGAIPSRWLAQLEVRDIIGALATAWEQASNMSSSGPWGSPEPDAEPTTDEMLARGIPTSREDLYRRFPGW